MKVKSLVLFGVLVLCGCTRPEEASRVLENSGYRDIEITGYNYFSCSKDDVFRTGFLAISCNGAKVEGTVCSSWFKGATIRFD